MAYQNLKSGDNLLLKVTEIKENVKTNIKFADGTKNRHDIYMVDPKTGTEYRGEYLTIGPYDYAFVKDVLQYIRCKCDNNLGCEVVPGTPPDERELEYLPNPHPGRQQTQPQIHQPRMVNISGSPVAFGYAYAKDIVLEQIRGFQNADKIALGPATLTKMIADLGDALTDRMIEKAWEISAK